MSDTNTSSKPPTTAEKAKRVAEREMGYIWKPYPPDPLNFEINQHGHLRTNDYSDTHGKKVAGS